MNVRHDNTRILLIEDDPHVFELIKEAFESSEYCIDIEFDGDSGLVAAQDPKYSLILLDIMLPGKDGWEICKELRSRNNDIPIIMLTAKSKEEDRILGFDLGADDYVTKPFSPRELLGRIRAVLKRSRSADERSSQQGLLQFNEIDLRVNLAARTVTVGKKEVILARKEFDFFAFLARNPNRAFSRLEIMQNVWGRADREDVKTVDEHVKRIRKRLNAAGINMMPLQTVWGIGYRFSTSGENDEG